MSGDWSAVVAEAVCIVSLQIEVSHKLVVFSVIVSVSVVNVVVSDLVLDKLPLALDNLGWVG